MARSKKTMPATYELMSERCGECLTSKNRIVPGARAAQLISGCTEQQVKFICHKASAAGRNIACAGVHEVIGGCQAFQLAERMGIEIVEINPNTLEPVEK